MSLKHLTLGAAIGLALTFVACASPSPTVPAPPTQTLPVVSGLTIGGVPTSFSYRQSVQLTAFVTLPDGAQKQTLDAVWQSSDKSVASVSDTGLLVVTGFGDADVMATLQNVHGTAHVTLPKPPEPGARRDVRIDSRGSTRALVGASQVTFDMSGSEGLDLHYTIDFGDGTSSTGTSVATHVYPYNPLSSYIPNVPCCNKVFTAIGTATDRFGSTHTATKEVIVVSLRGSDDGTWVTGASCGQGCGTHYIRFKTDGGPAVTGTYWNSNTAGSVAAFTGTIGPDGHVQLVLDDGSMAFDGSITLNDSPHSGQHLLLAIRGGAADGTTADFAYQDHY